MNREANIARFEKELSKVQRPGMDRLLNYIRNSDFYTAPASTKYHLSCEGGLLQHSLNVLDALQGMMIKENDGQNEDGTPRIKYHYAVAGQFVVTIPEESLIIIALLHDICKTHFYAVSTRNAKNEQTGQWEKVPYYTVKDRMPLGHGAKSAMLVKEYINLSSPELYAIWWHMGFSDTSDAATLGQAIEKYPIIWALHNADMMASKFMEGEKDNNPAFICEPTAEPDENDGEPPMPDEPVFMEVDAL